MCLKESNFKIQNYATIFFPCLKNHSLRFMMALPRNPQRKPWFCIRHHLCWWLHCTMPLSYLLSCVQHWSTPKCPLLPWMKQQQLCPQQKNSSPIISLHHHHYGFATALPLILLAVFNNACNFSELSMGVVCGGCTLFLQEPGLGWRRGGNKSKQ